MLDQKVIANNGLESQGVKESEVTPYIDIEESESSEEALQNESKEKVEIQSEEIKSSEVPRTQEIIEGQDIRMKEMMASLSREELTTLLRSINVEIDKKVI